MRNVTFPRQFFFSCQNYIGCANDGCLLLPCSPISSGKVAINSINLVRRLHANHSTGTKLFRKRVAITQWMEFIQISASNILQLHDH